MAIPDTAGAKILRRFYRRRVLDAAVVCLIGGPLVLTIIPVRPIGGHWLESLFFALEILVLVPILGLYLISTWKQNDPAELHEYVIRQCEKGEKDSWLFKKSERRWSLKRKYFVYNNVLIVGGSIAIILASLLISSFTDPKWRGLILTPSLITSALGILFLTYINLRLVVFGYFNPSTHTHCANCSYQTDLDQSKCTECGMWITNPWDKYKGMFQTLSPLTLALIPFYAVLYGFAINSIF